MAVYTQIDNPELYFQTVLWTGDDSTDNAITFDGSENMRPDMIWLKPRTKVDNHRVMDSVRGVTKMVPTNGSGAEETISAGLASFDSNGFTLNTTDSGYNSSSYTYVAWCWKAGTSFSNDASATSIGSLDSTASVNSTSGISILSYTGNASSGASVAHGMGSGNVPKFIAIKNRTQSAEGWQCYHVSLGATKRIMLDETGAVSTHSTFWNDTTPTSSVITLGSNHGTNGSSHEMIAYCFTDVQGFSSIKKYAGNSSNNGAYVHLGFSPAFLLFKEFTSGTNDSWYIIDNKRNTYNPRNKNLRPNNTDAEQEASWLNIDFLANGYKINDDDAAINESGREYVVIAFASAPFVNSKGVPNNAR